MQNYYLKVLIFNNTASKVCIKVCMVFDFLFKVKLFKVHKMG
jgi:hypothetical protein